MTGYFAPFMLSTRLMAFVLTACISLCAVAHAQDFPTKPIRINGGAPGGSPDFLMRILSPLMSESIGQPVIVENRSGGLLAIETVAKAAPDGYTLLVENTGMWAGPLFNKLSYDPIRDFLPVTLTNRQPQILTVHPSLPVKSVKDLIALAKAKPGDLNYASNGVGGGMYMAAELFKSVAQLKIVEIRYKVTAQGLTDLIGGQIQLSFPYANSVFPHLKSGRLKALGVTTPEPSAMTPGIPTVASAGLPGYEWVSIQGVFVPAKAPAPIIAKLNQEIVRALNRPEVKEKFITAGSEVVAGTPEQFGAAIKSDMAKVSRVIKEAGIKVE